MNVPYVKKFDYKGVEINQFVNGVYASPYPNRRERRQFKNNKSFTGNSKGIKLNVSGKYKYERVLQSIKDKVTGFIKFIKHSIPR